MTHPEAQYSGALGLKVVTPRPSQARSSVCGVPGAWPPPSGRGPHGALGPGSAGYPPPISSRALPPLCLFFLFSTLSFLSA